MQRKTTAMLTGPKNIYTFLSSRNETSSNVQHFDDIHLKFLTHILQAVQKYSSAMNDYINTSKELERQRIHYVTASSIVYEVMCGWDKVSHLYKLSIDEILYCN